MSSQEREGTKLSEAIKLASRRHMLIWPSLRPIVENVANLGLKHLERNGRWSKEVWGESDRVTNLPSMDAQISSFVLSRPCDPVCIASKREEENRCCIGRSGGLCQSRRLARQMEVAREFLALVVCLLKLMPGFLFSRSFYWLRIAQVKK